MSDASSSQRKAQPRFIECERIYLYLSWQPSPNILVLDMRTRQQFEEDGHLRGFHLVNIDPQLVRDGMTPQELAANLSGYHRENFMRRADFDMLLLMDNDSQDWNATLFALDSCLCNPMYNKPMQRMPAMVKGGAQSWIHKCRTKDIKVIDGFMFGPDDGKGAADVDTAMSRLHLNNTAADYLTRSTIGA